MAFTSRGVAPDFVLMTTTPEVRFPYSAEGMPRITSTDSILSGEMERKSVPRPLVVWSFIEFIFCDELAPEAAVENACMLASFDTGAPSMMIAVPKALFASLDISRIFACATELISGF